MNIKQAVSVVKKVAPLIPVFGNWKKATGAYLAIQYVAPLVLELLNKKKKSWK
ncbi:MAG: hypothetical protein SOR94_04210 [Lawsonella sp.]|uniref:hypothetical protein n=1 Tax=Lawsonella sp. TaxID=2041415 RepID=UPI002A754D7F|nr:hypothetical protein [Lawsonella sp.]MDY2979225.1 hypothetical protein [Lawsonella sp.]